MKVKSITKAAAAVICAAMFCGMFTGCGTKSAASVLSSGAISKVSDVPGLAAQSSKRTITDMAGKKVTIPSTVKKVFCTSPIGTYNTYTLAPDKLLGWNSALSADAKQYIAKKYQDLAVLGGTMGGKNTFNTEQIIKLKPDVILDFEYKGQVPDSIGNLQKQTGIPVVELDYSLDSTEAAYRLLGEILCVQQRADTLADYVKKSLSETRSQLAKVPENKKAKVYYAEADNGLKTDGGDSMHTEALSFVGATNVAEVKSEGHGMGISVSMEQVLLWNPDIILANSQMGGTTFVSKVYSNSDWAGVSAVKNKKIYLIPSLPFNWFDRPPSVARVLGVEWLGNLLYPDYVKVDMKSEVKKFYSTFYGVNVTDAQINTLLKNVGSD